MKEMKESIRQIFENENNDKKLEWISQEMYLGTVLWESEPLIKKSAIWTVNMSCFNFTNKFW